jgi:hypothetical protein
MSTEIDGISIDIVHGMINIRHSDWFMYVFRGTKITSIVYNAGPIFAAYKHDCDTYVMNYEGRGARSVTWDNKNGYKIYGRATPLDAFMFNDIMFTCGSVVGNGIDIILNDHPYVMRIVRDNMIIDCRHDAVRLRIGGKDFTYHSTK